MSGGSLGLNQEYSREYSLDSANGGLGGSARLEYGARVAQSSSTSGRVGYSDQSFRRRVWATSCTDEDDFCTSEFIWMNPTPWND